MNGTDALFEFIKQRAGSEVEDRASIKSVPCKAITNNNDGTVMVEDTVTGSKYNLPNFSGSVISDNENVKVFYSGNMILESNAYIGACQNKNTPTGNVGIKYVIGTSYSNGGSSSEVLLSKLTFDSYYSTNVFLHFSSTISAQDNGNASIIVYIDGMKHQYKPSFSVVSGSPMSFSFSVPFSVTAGRHRVRVTTVSSGVFSNVYCYVWGQGIDGDSVVNDSKITVIQLDDNLRETENVSYFDTVALAKAFLLQNLNNKYRVVVGNDLGLASLGANAFENCSNIYYIWLNDQLRELGNYAFSHCSNLQAIVIPENVTIINNYAFQYCNSLTDISIPDGVSLIAQSAFRNCISLTEIHLPDSLGLLGNMSFASCSSLKSISIPSGIQDIPTMCFTGCGLETIEFPERLLSIGTSAFRMCYNLTSVTFPNSLKVIGNYAFAMDNNYTGNPGAEWKYQVLQEVNLNDGLDVIGNCAFQACVLESIEIPSSVTSISATNDRQSFITCYNLKSIVVHKTSGSISGSPWGAIHATVTWTG